MKYLYWWKIYYSILTIYIEYWIYLILIKNTLFIFFLSYIVVLAEDAIKAALSDYNIKQKQKLKNNDNSKNRNETWFWYIQMIVKNIRIIYLIFCFLFINLHIIIFINCVVIGMKKCILNYI